MYIVTEGLSIPQSEIKDFCQPPLHKGAFLLVCLLCHFAVILQVWEIQLP